MSADAAKLERALENLIDNARKYTPDDGELRISARTDREAVVIEIANSAPDMGEDELPHLFERFYRREGRGPCRTAAGRDWACRSRAI